MLASVRRTLVCFLAVTCGFTEIGSKMKVLKANPADCLEPVDQDFMKDKATELLNSVLLNTEHHKTDAAGSIVSTFYTADFLNI